MSRLKQEKLAEMTAVQLKEMLQRQGLSTSGTKQMMIDRLLMANPAGPGVMVVETVSASRRKKSTPMPEEDAHTPEAAPQLSESEVEAAATNEPVAGEPPPAENDAAALITQLQELVAQAQAAATAARKAQKKAEAAAAAVKQKKDKKGDKKKKDKKKDRVLQEG